jgi:2-oxoisovalerate dehydrogenase E2 component (dihydrolipoyl transacylase)
MSQFIFKMPDLGEGTVEAEIVAWHTEPNAFVTEDQVIVEVMTDKAAVEVPAPVTGRIVSINGAPGDKIAVGSPLVVFEVGAADTSAAATNATAASVPAVSVAAVSVPAASVPAVRAPAAGVSAVSEPAASVSTPAPSATAPPGPDGPRRVMASPANRRRAREAGVDLGSVAGSGPGGRILRDDLAAAAGRPAAGKSTAAEVTEIKVIGLRRLIAERMSAAKREIPHFAYVEEVDVTELDALRRHLNTRLPEGAGSLTFLPLVILALVRVLEDYPQCNALYDASRGVLQRHRSVHVGVATQTPDGLKVPVVRDAQALGLWEIAAAVRRLAGRARSNSASRDELTGSTITVTSLGKLGGIVSTPIINAPEVAIIGLNKAVDRPVVRHGAVTVRHMMNLSSSFDHRFVDGYDAAAMIQGLKELLEHPATIFIPKVKAP